MPILKLRTIIFQSVPMSSRKIPEKNIDIAVLNAEIKQIVAREQVLRDEIDKIIAEIEVDGDAIN